MRYNDKVIFVSRVKGEYDPETGKNKPSVPIEKPMYANVTDLGIDRKSATFGDYKKQCKTIRLLNHYKDKWDYVLIDGKKFQFVGEMTLRKKQTFVVEEVK